MAEQEYDLVTIPRSYLRGRPGPIAALYGNLDHVVEDEEQLRVIIDSRFMGGAVKAAMGFYEGIVSHEALLPPKEILGRRCDMESWRATMDYLGVDIPPLIGDVLVRTKQMRPSLAGPAKLDHLRMSSRVFGDRLASYLVHFAPKSLAMQGYNAVV